MVEFQIDDMTCGHCVATITRTILAADPAAAVSLEVPTHRARIDSATLSGATLAALISAAGYTPVPR